MAVSDHELDRVDDLGPKRGEVSVSDRVMCEMGIGEPPAEGQVVAETEDGNVIVSIFNGTVEKEFERHQVWRNGFSIEEI